VPRVEPDPQDVEPAALFQNRLPHEVVIDRRARDRDQPALIDPDRIRRPVAMRTIAIVSPA
jgi:hypothetical protein